MVGAVSMATGLWAGPSGIGFPDGEVSFPLLHKYIPALQPTKRPIPTRSSFGVNAAGMWFGAVVSSVKIKNKWNCTPSFPSWWVHTCTFYMS